MTDYDDVVVKESLFVAAPIGHKPHTAHLCRLEIRELIPDHDRTRWSDAALCEKAVDDLALLGGTRLNLVEPRRDVACRNDLPQLGGRGRRLNDLGQIGYAVSPPSSFRNSLRRFCNASLSMSCLASRA